MHFVDLGESFLFSFRRDALKELSNEYLLEKYYRSLFSRFSIEEYCRSLFRRLLSQYSRLRAGEREAIRLAESLNRFGSSWRPRQRAIRSAGLLGFLAMPAKFSKPFDENQWISVIFQQQYHASDLHMFEQFLNQKVETRLQKMKPKDVNKVASSSFG